MKKVKNTKLGIRARKVIEQYLNLPSPLFIKCPYFNNRRVKNKSGIRPLIGKGSPEEIVEEAKIIALREHIELKNIPPQERTKFMVENGLGIDCSGFAYHVLSAELAEKDNEFNEKSSLAKILKVSEGKSFIRKIISKLRPVESTNVKAFANKKVTEIVDLFNIEAGDFIVMLNEVENHILVIEKTEINDKGESVIEYCHSIAWPKDGKYDHGISRGTIILTGNELDITEGIWNEKEVMEHENVTKEKAVKSEYCAIHRVIVKKNSLC